MFKNVFHINPDINLLHTNIEKDYIEFSENGTRNDEKQMPLKKACRSDLKGFLRTWKMLKMRYLSDAVKFTAASYAKNTIKVRYLV